MMVSITSLQFGSQQCAMHFWWVGVCIAMWVRGGGGFRGVGLCVCVCGFFFFWGEGSVTK